MKKRILFVLVLCLVLVGCEGLSSSIGDSTLTCSSDPSVNYNITKYIITYDSENNVKAIEFIRTINYENYYNEKELKDLKANGKLDGSQFGDIVSCDNVQYECSTTLDGNILKHRKYVNSKSVAVSAGLGRYYDMKVEAIRREMESKDLICG